MRGNRSISATRTKGGLDARTARSEREACLQKLIGVATEKVAAKAAKT